MSLRVTGPLAPLVGILVGALGGSLYGLASQLWPASVAVILAMAATALATTALPAISATRFDVLARMLLLLIKFNALLALSAAKLPFAAPAYFAPALIMICSYAASYALMVFVLAARPDNSTPKIAHPALILALALGFAPATLLGLPGLVGLAAAVIIGLSIMALLKYRRIGTSRDVLELTQLTSEAAFYLGALASWRFV